MTKPKIKKDPECAGGYALRIKTFVPLLITVARPYVAYTLMDLAPLFLSSGFLGKPFPRFSAKALNYVLSFRTLRLPTPKTFSGNWRFIPSKIEKFQIGVSANTTAMPGRSKSIAAMREFLPYRRGHP